MKNKIFSMIALCSLMLLPNAFAENENFFGIGAELFQEPYNKKVIVTKVFQNTPAEQAGIVPGVEIVSVDGKKVRKMECICEVVSSIRGENGTTVKLTIKPKWWKWETIELTRGEITVPLPDENPQKEAYWKQIAPVQYAYSQCYPKEVSNKFSRKYKRKIMPIINYWLERRQKYDVGYNTCASYSKENQESCFINLLNRENEITLADKRIFTYLQYIERK